MFSANGIMEPSLNDPDSDDDSVENIILPSDFIIEEYYDASDDQRSDGSSTMNGDDQYSDESREGLDSDNERVVYYDIDTPMTHSYLGSLDAVQSPRTLFPENTWQKLFIIKLPDPDIILVPGQTIPLSSSRSSFVSTFRLMTQNNQTTFGIVVDLNHGTTAEIRDVKFEGEVCKLKAEGRQRFFFTTPLETNVSYGDSMVSCD